MIRRRLTSASLLLWAKTRPRVGQLVYTFGGLGDELLLTAIAREARRLGRPLAVMTRRPEVWEGNPDPTHVLPGDDRWFLAAQRGWVRTTITHAGYQSGQREHIAEQMARHLGIRLPADWRPVLYWPEATAARREDYVVVQNSCRGALYAAETKEWPQSHWTELVSGLTRTHRVVHLGTPADPHLPGVEDLRGKTTLRDAVGMLAKARLFVGLESGTMHLAAAAGTPSVIILGGRTLPGQTTYPHHRLVAHDPGCAGCWLNQGCPNGRACLTEIPVSRVLTEVAESLGKPSRMSLAEIARTNR